MASKTIIAKNLKKGDFICEKGGSVFEILSIKDDGLYVNGKVDTSMYFLSFRTKTKDFKIKKTQKVQIL